MESKDYELITELVLTEVKRAKTLFPNDFVNQDEGYFVLYDAVEELFGELKKNKKNYDLLAQRKEAIKVAAMAIRFATELTKTTDSEGKKGYF